MNRSIQQLHWLTQYGYEFVRKFCIEFIHRLITKMKIFSFTIVEFLLKEHTYNWCCFKASYSFALSQYMILWSLRSNSPKGILFAPPHVRSFMYIYILKSARTKKRKKKSAPLGCILYMYVCVCIVYMYNMCIWLTVAAVFK